MPTVGIFVLSSEATVKVHATEPPAPVVPALPVGPPPPPALPPAPPVPAPPVAPADPVEPTGPVVVADVPPQPSRRRSSSGIDARPVHTWTKNVRIERSPRR